MTHAAQPAHSSAQLAIAFNHLALLLLRPETEDAGDALAALADLFALPMPEVELLTGDALEREYAKLFLGVGPETTALSESAWTSPLHLLCQDAQFECRRAYAACGMAPHAEGTPEDHLGLMTAFLALTLEAGQAEAAKVFAEQHPAKWVPAWAVTLERREDAALYKTVAAALLAALEELRGL